MGALFFNVDDSGSPKRKQEALVSVVKEVTAVVETQGKARNSVNISKCGSLEVTEGLSHHTVFI